MYQIDLKPSFIIDLNTNQQLLFFVSTKLNDFLILAVQYIVYSKLSFIFVRVIYSVARIGALSCCFERDKKASDGKQQNEENGGHKKQAHVENSGPTSP